MNSKIYFNPEWSKSRQGMAIPLWSSLHPEGISKIEEQIDHNEFKPSPILFVGGVHGDEPEGVWLAEALLNWIQTQYWKRRNSKSALQLWPKLNWVLIPCLNPEGYSRLERTNSSGVDLNRNFPSPDWSSEIKAPRYHPGLNPGSEPEVQAVLKTIQIYKPKLIIHFHSWKPCIVFTGEPAQKWAEKLGKISGYPIHEDIGYPTPGSLGQYAWLSLKIPVICIEEQEGSKREQIWPRFQHVLMELFQ